MRFLVAVAVSALAAVVSAQSLTDLPKCAQDCVGTSLSTTGCNGLQIACICNSSKWISGLSCCVKDSCSKDETQKTITFAGQLCSSYGITVPNNAEQACAAAQQSGSSASASAAGSATASRAASSAVSAAASATRSGSADQTRVGTAGLGFVAFLAALL